MKTGNMPAPKADPTPAKEIPADGQKPEAKSAPDSEPGKPQEPRKSNADTRLNELLDDLREAGLTPKALKSFKSDYQRTQTEAARPPEQTAKPVESGPKAPVKPKAEDFEGKSWAEYEAAKDKYFEDLADFKAANAIENDRRARHAEAQQKELQGKVDAAKERYGPEADKTIRETADTIFGDPKISGVVKSLVDDSPVLVDLMYVLGGKPDDLADFIKTAQSNPSAAVRKLVLVEKLVMEELAKGSADTTRDETGKFKASTPEKKTTQAPAPPKEVGGTSAAPPDDVEAAIKRGDDRAAIDAMNRAEIRRRKGH